MKPVQKILNNNFKEKYIAFRELEKEMIIKALENNFDEFQLLEPVDKFIVLRYLLWRLSFFNDTKLIKFLESLGVSRLVTNYFVSIYEIFEKLDEFNEKSVFLFNYGAIFTSYSYQSISFFDRQLMYDLGFNVKEMIPKLKRQEKNMNLPKEFKVLHNKILNNFREYGVENFDDPKLPIYEDSLVRTIGKVINFPHRVNYFPLYNTIVDTNKKFGKNKFLENDFICDFYDLLKILFRDKTQLNENEETVSKYYNMRDFKIKRVKKLILS